MPNTTKTGYSLDFSISPPSVKIYENESGTSIVFETVSCEGASLVLLYRQAGTSSWSESDPLNNPAQGDQITVSNLTENTSYEFTPVAASESYARGERSKPGDLIRTVPSSGCTLEKIKSQVAADLQAWIQAPNIFCGSEIPGKCDQGEKAALVNTFEQERKRLSSGVVKSLFETSIKLYYFNRDKDERDKILERLAQEVTEFFDSNITSFSSIPGYFDSQATKIAFEKPKSGTAIVKIKFISSVII